MPYNFGHDDPAGRRAVALAVYERLGSMNEVFVEWRNKILTFGVSGVAVMLAAAQYLHRTERHFAWVGGLGGACVASAMALADHRNASILKQIYDDGKALEQRLGMIGFYENFKQGGWPTYGWIIRYLGIVLGSLSVALGIIWSF